MHFTTHARVLLRIPQFYELKNVKHVPTNILLYVFKNHFTILSRLSGFGGLGVACWPLVSKFAGSNPAETVGFFRAKNPQHAFLREGSKAVCPTLYIYGM